MGGIFQIAHEMFLKIETLSSILQQEKMTNSPEAQDKFLNRIWKAWIRFGHWMGTIMSWVWMPLFYFIIAMPVAMGVKFFSDPLQLSRKKKASYWTPKKLPKLDLDWAKSQGSTVIPTSESK
jgi:hypothetical protein